MNEMRSIGVVPGVSPPEFHHSSAISTASEPRETLSAPERKYEEATSRAEYSTPSLSV